MLRILFLITWSHNNLYLFKEWWPFIGLVWLMVEETGVPGENHQPLASHWQTLSHSVVSSTQSPWTGFKLTTFSGDRHWLALYITQTHISYLEIIYCKNLAHW